MSGKSSRPSGARLTPRPTVRCGGKPVMSEPFKEMRPARGVRRPMMALTVVVFPAPFGPNRHTVSPAWTSRRTA